METIFISIASYRDPELLPTLRDAIANTKNAKRLRSYNSLFFKY